MFLRPCPFCGNDDFRDSSLSPVRLVEVKSLAFGLSSDKAYHVKCFKCFSCGGLGVSGHNALTGTTETIEEAQEIAVKKWNTRTNFAG